MSNDLMKKFLPGQWLDVHIPGVSKPGGFTITSPPRDALFQAQPRTQQEDLNSNPLPYPSIELAIQHSPQNPAAAWFWQAKSHIVNSELQVRVGGRFVWPPANLDPDSITRLVFIAGGVGIKCAPHFLFYFFFPFPSPKCACEYHVTLGTKSYPSHNPSPLISILSHLSLTKTTPPTVRFLYSSNQIPRRDSPCSPLNPDEERILFLSRLRSLLSTASNNTNTNARLDLFLTGGKNNNKHPILSPPSSQLTNQIINGKMTVQIHDRRITPDDLIDALPPLESKTERKSTVCYVCGPSRMTDWIVDFLRKDLALGEEKVLCERWW